MKHIHIVGIGGTFMGSLARLAVESGFHVTGCDNALYPPMSDQLAELGVVVHHGFGEDNLSFQPDIWVIGNFAKRGMPLIEALLNQGALMVSGPEWLHQHILLGRHVLAVAGTHGKTTTSSMLSWILSEAGLAPGFLIGGVPSDFGVSARLGRSPYFVIEADEYDTAFFDKRSKFLHYPAKTAVFNNLEYDHADIFADLAAIETQFHHWVRTLPADGLIVSPVGEAALERVLDRGCWSRRAQIDAPGGWQARPILGLEADNAFEVWHGDQWVARVPRLIPGTHNRANALAAFIASLDVGVAAEVAAKALAGFAGVARRLQSRGVVGQVEVIDDFAHHPTAIELTIDALLQQRPGRILAVIEPRSNTMKLGVMASRLPGALSQAVSTFAWAPGLEWVRNALAPLGASAQTFDDLDALVASVVQTAQAGDRILVMSNGGFGGVHSKLLSALAERFKT